MKAIIAALTKKQVIGKRNALPWSIKEELQLFKKQTLNTAVIMGKNTFLSIGRPLPKRTNYVVSRSLSEQVGITVCRSLKEAIRQAEKDHEKIFIIGGSSIYKQALEEQLVDHLCLSWIKKEYEGDAYFPKVNFSEWEEISREEYNEFDFIIYKKKN